MTTAKTSAGFNEAEGYAASLRQQASWIEESPAAEMIDADELRAAANFIERLAAQAGADAVRETLQTRCFSMSEPYLNGWRLIVGFSTREEVDAAQEAIAGVARVTAAQAQTLCGMIAAIYGELDAEDCAVVDREWARMRGYILPTNGRNDLAYPSVPGEAGIIDRAMALLEDIPGETLLDRVHRLVDWHQQLSSAHNDLLAAQPSVSGVEREALMGLNDAIDLYWNEGRTDGQAKNICYWQLRAKHALALIEQPAEKKS